jgi:hypothetical protein
MALLIAGELARTPADRSAPPISARAAEESTASAANLGFEVLGLLGPLEPRPGAWAEYVVRSRDGAGRVRFSALPSNDGRAWLELAAFGGGGVPFAVRLLLSPATRGSADVERAVLYVLGHAPLELPLDDLRERLEADRGTDRGKWRVRSVRSASVTVPAGRFESEEVRIASSDGPARVGRTARVPLWGLVSTRSRDRSMDLAAYGWQGAHSVIPDQGTGRERTNQ